MEAPPGFEPGMEVLQTSALPLGDGAVRKAAEYRRENGAGNGIRTRDFDLGKVALYHCVIPAYPETRMVTLPQ